MIALRTIYIDLFEKDRSSIIWNCNRCVDWNNMQSQEKHKNLDIFQLLYECLK